MGAGRRNDGCMADPSHGAKPLRVLLSEGSSTSAREVITALGLAGHVVEVCDPSSICLGRFSRFVSKFHRCPGLRDDPAGYLSFVEKLLAERPYDVLLPIHEQGLLFARVRERLEASVENQRSHDTPFPTQQRAWLARPGACYVRKVCAVTRIGAELPAERVR